jgi:hypothetical protein
VSTTDVSVAATRRTFDGVEGGWRSGQATVETVAPLRGERFPARSKASTSTM